VSTDSAALVCDNLELWTSAIERKSGAGRGGRNKVSLYGIERLRALILALAVQGKLVSQDTRDESAIKLLARIRSSKPEYLTNHDLPKQRPLTGPIEQVPFEVPKGWIWTRLGDIAAYIQRGKSPKYSDGSGVYVVSQRCVQWTGLDLSVAKEISQASLENYETYRFLRPDDLLWNSTGTGTIGRVIALNEVPEGLVCDSHVTLVRCPWVNARYLQTWLASDAVYGQIEVLAAGSTSQIEWTAQLANGQLVPLPPLAEQQRIVAKVDELMALCDALEAQSALALEAHQTLVETLLAALVNSADATDLAAKWERLQSHFDLLFTTESSIDALKHTILDLSVRGVLSGETFIPNHWSVERFADVLDIQGGGQPPKSKFSDIEKPGYVQLIQIRDLGPSPQPVYIPRSLASKFCTSEDIMIGRYGASVGKVFRGKDGAYNVALVKVIDKHNRFFRPFLFNLLRSPTGQSFFSGMSRSAQAGFNKGDLANVMLPIPPLSEQKRIVEKVDALMALCAALGGHIAEAAEAQKNLADAIFERAAA
jgi:type I restriction enzyme S subunit